MDVEGKKRKRRSPGSPSPNKKAATGGESIVERIRIRVDDQLGLPPALLSSPGLLPPSVPFHAYTKQVSPAHRSDASIDPRTHHLLLRSAQHPRLDYSASSLSLDPALSHYVGIFDPATKQLQLAPAHSLSLRGTLRSEPKDKDLQKRTLGQQRAELNREFGTKKAKKALTAKTVNAITSNAPGSSSVQDAVLEAMGGSATPLLNEHERLAAELASKPIPMPDLTAKDAKDVYAVDVLMPPSDARLVPINEWQEMARKKEEFFLSHRFPAYRVAALGEGEDVPRLKALGYLLLLLQFHDALQNGGRSGKKVPKNKILHEKLSAWPERLVDSVRRRFANEQNELPKWNLDNLYTHMCALALYVDGGAMDVAHLRDDLKMGESKEITRYFRELGCTVSPPTERERESLGAWFDPKHRPMPKAVAAVTKVARLKMPLDFPRGVRRR